MAQVVEKLQPWLAALERRPHGGPALAAGSARSRRRRVSPRSDSRPCATRSGGSRTWRRLPATEFVAGGGRGARAPSRISAVSSTPTQPIASLSSTAASHAQLSRVSALPNGVRVGSLAAAVTEHADVVQRYLGQLAEFGTKAFTALNTALAVDGALRLHSRRRRARRADSPALRDHADRRRDRSCRMRAR